MIALELLSLAAGGAALAPAGVVAGQCLAGCLPWRRSCRLSRASARPALAVLIPAHDEALMIEATVRGARAQLAPGDRLVVVADNCSDDTAALAAGAGAEVLERFDDERRGKGFALEHGVRHLLAADEPPVALVVIDADTRLLPGSLDALARHAGAGHVVQADNLVERPAGAPPLLAVAELAFLIRNRARGEGWRRLGLPVQITGTGFALPLRLLETRSLGGSHLAEDLWLGLELALAGHAPQRCPCAGVRSPLPSSAAAAAQQRSRWESGRESAASEQALRLAKAAWTQRSPGLLALALDLAVPPLTRVLSRAFLASVFSLSLALCGLASPAGFLLASAGLFGLAGALALAAWVHGSQRLQLRSLSAIPRFVGWRIAARLRSKARPSEWVRAERG